MADESVQYREDAVWLRQHLWQMHMPNWEARITRILDALDALDDPVGQP